MLRFTDNRNQAINKKIAGLTLSEYNKGLQINHSEEVGDEGNEDELDTIKPVNNFKTQKKGYSAKKKMQLTKSKLISSKDSVKDFINQSHMLDNELNQMLSQFKLNNKEEFYGGDVSDSDDDDGSESSEEEVDEDSDEEDIDYTEVYNGKIRQILKFVKSIPASILKKHINEEYGVKTTKGNFSGFLKAIFPTKNLQGDALSDDEMSEQIDRMDEFYNELRSLIQDSNDDNDEEDTDSDDSEGEDSDSVEELPEPKTKAQLQEYLQSHNMPIIRERSAKKGDQGRLLPPKKSDLMQSYLQQGTGKSKNGISVKNNIHVKNFSQDLLILIKKVNNIVTNLIPIAQNLSDDHFNGAVHNEINNIKKVYEDMDQKMFILTSMSTEATQLQKLEFDFERLYTSVIGGVSSYVPMTGGSIPPISNKIYYPVKHSVKTEFLHLL